MSSLALEIDRVMPRLAPERATRLERRVRDELALALADEASQGQAAGTHHAWLQRLTSLRSSVGTGKTGPSTEAILEDLRSNRD